MPQSWFVSTPPLRRVLALLVCACFLASCTSDASTTLVDPPGSGGSEGSGGEESEEPAPPPSQPESPGGGWEDPTDGQGLRAFPGAEGFGSGTAGGRGGKVYVVTTLNWSGPGSFSEAMRATEPRIIVFRVSGVIQAPSYGISLTEANSYVTVAGQTSPGGVTFVGSPDQFIGSYETNFHDGIFRFLRFRGRGNNDCISFNEAHHLVFDHCDFSGSEDEAVDITEGHHVTFQWNTVMNSEASKGGKGTLFAYFPNTGFSIHHNFYAHHYDRFFPHFHWAEGGVPPNTVIEFSNNVGYNPMWDAAMWNSDSVPPANLTTNLIGNYIKAGPSTPAGFVYGFKLTKGSNVYNADNVFPGHSVFDSYEDLNPVAAPAAAPPITYHSSSQVFDAVLSKAGAFPRDPMNTRVVQEARNGTGQPEQLNDVYLQTSWAPPADSDLDGMPDDWESERGLDPNNAADAALDRDGDGYTNIEEYINGVAAFLIPD